MFRSLLTTVTISALLLAVLSGCGSGSAVAPVPETQLIGISLPGNASQLTLSGGATSAQFTVSEPGYFGSFTATSSNTAVATVTPATETVSSRVRRTESAGPESATFTVDAVANGTATVSVTDQNDRKGAFTVVVSGLSTSPTPTPSPSASPSASPRPTASPSPSATPHPTPSPSPSPSPTPTPQPVIASPSSVSLTSIGATQPVTVSEGGYGGSFTAASANTAVATVTPASGTSFTVTAVAVGSTTITFTSANGTLTTVGVTVTTTTGTISSLGRHVNDSAQLADGPAPRRGA